jgi:hypothetical protein
MLAQPLLKGEDEKSAKESTMALIFRSVQVGNHEIERLLSQSLQEMGTPADEDWGIAIQAASPDAAWEVVLDGPARPKSAHVDWEIVQNGTCHYRKLFLARAEHTVEAVRLSLRRLFWDGIRFKDNPIKSKDLTLASAFEEAVWSLLRAEEMEDVDVRFGVWREGPDEPRYVCKIEHETTPSPLPRFPWTWRSSLLRTPKELKGELAKALAARRRERPAVLAQLASHRRAMRLHPAAHSHQVAVSA